MSWIHFAFHEKENNCHKEYGNKIDKRIYIKGRNRCQKKSVIPLNSGYDIFFFLCYSLLFIFKVEKRERNNSAIMDPIDTIAACIDKSLSLSGNVRYHIIPKWNTNIHCIVLYCNWRSKSNSSKGLRWNIWSFCYCSFYQFWWNWRSSTFFLHFLYSLFMFTIIIG